MASAFRFRPVAAGVTLPSDALSIWPTLARQPFPFILDYTDPTQPDRPWTILGSNPARVWIAKGDRIEEWRAGRKRTLRGDPFEVLRAALAEHAVSDDDTGLPFAGGAVGYLGYDLGGRIESLPRQAVDDRGFPDLFLAFYDRALVLDRAANRARLVELAPRDPPRAIDPRAYDEHFGSWPPLSPRACDRPVASNFTREGYLAAVRRAREYIAAGDIYQVNLSQRFHARMRLDPFDIYARLRSSSPAPYSALLSMGARAVVSSSPELFLHARERHVVTRPIKGTRSRGADPAEDERLRAELLSSPKDDAELAMIVDLERNDLGRVCEFGSVKVTQPKALETHPTVHHLVATVEGRLRRDADAIDLLRATFPGGSITGAPKIRAMEIIDEIEPTRRAAYTGAIGWIGFDGRVALSIAIRIVERHGEDLWFQVGGGIVADSDPEQEFHETLVKATGIVRALGLDLPTDP
ncbi:MAG: aminodeoxychorismate synthase component I [Planctomycetes bacterium]|nr:aminodeoxychorismate synthase component I [Planctomycetota bacterium]